MLFSEEVGLLFTGTIVGYNGKTNKAQVKLVGANATSSNKPVEIILPTAIFNNDGPFVGTLPKNGTPVVVGQGSGGEYFFVSFKPSNTDYVPSIKKDELLLQSNDSTKITLDGNYNIKIGSDINNIRLNAGTGIASYNFDEEFSFTQASRSINGLVKRDLKINKKFPQSIKLTSDDYDKYYYKIGMDPSVSISVVSGSNKNPAFVEKREQVYEFQLEADVADNVTESRLYGNSEDESVDLNYISRRNSRADTLSLTLYEPNYLMETVKGTVIDIFGNILDLNRYPIPVGGENETIKSEKSEDKTASFLAIKALERKSIAYHFEINARKDLTGQDGKVVLPDIDSNEDYGRDRSRFFIDVDKEGQFKINVPASSETGNIPLLTRYENYSTLTDNPDALFYREDNLDILHDSFPAPDFKRFSESKTVDGIDTGSKNRGSISIKNGDADGTPLDRITEKHIKHGTAYHDILSTCYAFTGDDYIRYQADTSTYRNINIDDIVEANAHLSSVVSDTIYVSGENANAGGRSGSINFDGSLEFNIGANTIDRQSLWIDMAGGIVGNIGRDLTNKSLAMNMDGDVYMQIGGVGVATDSRFAKSNNGNYGAVLDLRVITDGGYAHMIRIDNDGVKIMTPSFLQIHASQGMKISSDATIDIQAEIVKIQERPVMKGFGGSI